MDEHVVAFIDILGFRNFVKSGRVDSVVNDYQNILEKMRKFWSEAEIKKKFKSTLFSDSIIISAELSGDISTKRKVYKSLCIAIAHLQVEMLSKDIWIRGGVSHGKMKFKTGNDTLIYGKAFVNAYELETNVAKFPRVVIDPDSIDYLEFNNKNELTSYFNDNNYSNWKENVIFDTKKYYGDVIEHRFMNCDTSLFIDFFEAFTQNDLSGINLISRKELLNNLQKNLLNSTPSIYEKYNWVQTYILQKIEEKIAYSKENVKPLLDFRDLVREI